MTPEQRQHSNFLTNEDLGPSVVSPYVLAVEELLDSPCEWDTFIVAQRKCWNPAVYVILERLGKEGDFHFAHLCPTHALRAFRQSIEGWKMMRKAKGGRVG